MKMSEAVSAAALCVMIVGVCRAEPGGVIEAVAQARHDLDLGFAVQGRVASVLVEAGARVEAGQSLILLDDREGSEQVRIFEIRAKSTLEVEAAEAEWLLDENEAKRLEEAMASAGAAPFEVERARLEAKRSKLAYELFKQRRDETAIQLRQARILHEKYELKAPISGMIEQVVVAPGETVEEGRPVLRMVVTDPLRIDAAAPMRVGSGLKVGQNAWVKFRASGRVVEGKVANIAAVADPGSETRSVLIDVQNPSAEGEPAGSHVLVSFESGEEFGGKDAAKR